MDTSTPDTSTATPAVCRFCKRPLGVDVVNYCARCSWEQRPCGVPGYSMTSLAYARLIQDCARRGEFESLAHYVLLAKEANELSGISHVAKMVYETSPEGVKEIAEQENHEDFDDETFDDVTSRMDYYQQHGY